jgi:hypothetical protein
MITPPNANVATAFLKDALPTGPWGLTAIYPDQQRVEYRQFSANDLAACEAWIEERNGKANLYFQVNPPKDGITKKPSKADIRAVEFFHVDIDPRDGEPLSQERDRILRSLTSELPAGVPPPSIILDSGNGFWGLWRLDTAIPLEIIDTIPEVERYNRQLELTFGADACHNIDRLARLPGTVNIPTKTKVAKGREPTESRVVQSSMTAHDRSAFAQSPVSRVDMTMASSGRVNVDPGTMKKIAVEELAKWNVPDRVKVIIVQGKHPDEAPKSGDDSRSAWLFDVLCSLVRAGVPDDVIYSIIRDPDLGIAECVLDKGRNAHTYAVRQIERAHEAVIAPELQEMNEKYAVILDAGGTLRVARFSRDYETGRSTMSFQTPSDIVQGYANRIVDIGEGKTMPLGRWWLNHPLRRQYEQVVFDPTGRAPTTLLNLWTGFGVDPKQGDWSLMRAHILDVIAAGNQEHADYITKWLAWSVQNPGKPAEVAVALVGGKGTGKGTFVESIMRIFGNHAFRLSNPELLIGRFNGHLRDVCFLFGDEAYWPGSKKSEGALKALITEPEIAIEAKGVDAVPAPNRLHIILAGNEPWIVPAGADERRYAVFDLSSVRQQDHAYFAALRREMNTGGVAAMLYDLLAMNLDGWHPRQGIPRTAALERQKAQTLSPPESDILDMLILGELPHFAADVGGGRYFVGTTALAEHLRRRHGRPISTTRIGELLGKGRGGHGRGFGLEDGRERNTRGFYFEPLPNMRERWVKLRSEVEWPADTTDWIIGSAPEAPPF